MAEKPKFIDMEVLESAAVCLRTIAHPQRLRMIQILLTGTHTVGELAAACEIAPSSASEHLGKMRDRGLLVSHRQGRSTHYEVAGEWADCIIECIKHHFENTNT